MDPARSYRGVRVAVFGASGFIGRWVARRLDECGARLYLVVRCRAEAESVLAASGVSGELIEQNLGRLPQVQALVERVRPSITFNLAGYGVDRSERDEDQAFLINRDFVRTLCGAVYGVRDEQWGGQNLVHVGSALEYGTAGGNLEEDSPARPTTVYGRSKLAGTHAVSQCSESPGMRAVTARLFTVYGPGEHQGRLLPSLLDAAQTGNPLQLTAGTQRRDFTYVEDVARGLLRLGVAKTNPGEVINLATGRLTTVRQFVEIASGVLGIPAEHVQFGMLPTRSEEMEHEHVTIARLRQRTAWVPSTTIAAGVKKTSLFATWNAPKAIRR